MTNPHAPNVSPAQAGSLVPFDLEYPWREPGYPEALMPLLFPSDPWPLAEASGTLFCADDELRRLSQIPGMRRQKYCLGRIRELLGYRMASRHAAGWDALSASIRTMRGPDLPEHVLHLLPPQVASILNGLWSTYHQHLLRELWAEMPEDPSQDWRVLGLCPPFPVPAPAPVPPPPVEPAPDLWMAWTHPTQGSLSPVLLRSMSAPRPLDTLELQHTSGWTQAPTVIECPLALDRPEAEPIIRCLFHRQQGIWGDTARE